MLTVPSVSREFIHVPVVGGSLSTPVELAIIHASQEKPTEADWHTAVWDGATAKLLIGPGGTVELADGWYRVWVRVTSAPEAPVLTPGLLEIK